MARLAGKVPPALRYGAQHHRTSAHLSHGSASQLQSAVAWHAHDLCPPYHPGELGRDEQPPAGFGVAAGGNRGKQSRWKPAGPCCDQCWRHGGMSQHRTWLVAQPPSSAQRCCPLPRVGQLAGRTGRSARGSLAAQQRWLHLPQSCPMQAWRWAAPKLPASRRARAERCCKQRRPSGGSGIGRVGSLPRIAG